MTSVMIGACGDGSKILNTDLKNPVNPTTSPATVTLPNSQLPEVAKPTIACIGCKEEDAGNKNPKPPVVGKLYSRQFREVKIRRVVWNLYNGTNYIGSASMNYQGSLSIFSWNINEGNYVEARFEGLSNRQILKKTGKRAIMQSKIKVSFTF